MKKSWGANCESYLRVVLIKFNVNEPEKRRVTFCLHFVNHSDTFRAQEFLPIADDSMAEGQILAGRFLIC
jgi:hypothetical protein